MHENTPGNQTPTDPMKRLRSVRHYGKLALGLLLAAAASFSSFGQGAVVTIPPGAHITTNTLTVANGYTLVISPTAKFEVIVSAFLGNGSSVINNGTFIARGLVNGDAGSVLTFLGPGLFTSQAATFVLDNSKTFAISGVLDITTGVTFDVTGLTLPGFNGITVQIGSFPLGTDGTVIGDFDPTTTTVFDLGNPIGATFISETAGEGLTFDPLAQSVYWVQENAGQVSLRYSIAPTAAPEPGAAISLLTGVGLLLGFRRRWSNNSSR